MSESERKRAIVEARGEAGEVAAHLERLRRYRFISEQQLMQGLSLADRLCALLTGLIRRHS